MTCLVVIFFWVLFAIQGGLFLPLYDCERDGNDEVVWYFLFVDLIYLIPFSPHSINYIIQCTQYVWLLYVKRGVIYSIKLLMVTDDKLSFNRF